MVSAFCAGLAMSRFGVTPTSTIGTKSRSTLRRSFGCRLGARAWLLMCAMSSVLPSLDCKATYSAEALAMGLGQAATTVAAQALLFDEFVAREAAAGRFAPAFSAVAGPVLVHGHCHQKAFDTMAATLAALRLVPGADPALIESSCCGMAGSFGYEAAHHEVSMRMAEASLLPAVRAAPKATIVAAGTSFRHQIRDGTGR